MRVEIRTDTYVVWTLPLAARLRQRSLGNRVRAAYGVQRGKIFYWGKAPSFKAALREAEQWNT